MDRLGVDYSKKSPYLWYFETAEELAKVYEDYLKSSEQAPVDEVGAENDGVEDDVSQKGLDVEAEFTVEEQRIQDFIDAALGKKRMTMVRVQVMLSFRQWNYLRLNLIALIHLMCWLDWQQ